MATNGYVREGIGELFSGFVNIAREYYRKTSKSITLYGVYANKNQRSLSISKGIDYDLNKPFSGLKKRITQYLHRTMTEMARYGRNTKERDS